MNKATKTFENPLALRLEQKKSEETHMKRHAAAAERAKAFGTIVSGPSPRKQHDTMQRKSKVSSAHDSLQKAKVNLLKQAGGNVDHAVLLGRRGVVKKSSPKMSLKETATIAAPYKHDVSKDDLVNVSPKTLCKNSDADVIDIKTKAEEKRFVNETLLEALSSPMARRKATEGAQIGKVKQLVESIEARIKN